MTSRKAYLPAGHFTSKRMGELAELGFMYRAASHGIGVAKPYGDSFPYDFLTQHGKRVLRVQVKSCFSGERDGTNGFNITVARSRGHGKITYAIGDLDFIAAFVAECDAWYLVPMEAVGQKKSIRLYPVEKNYRKGSGLYEQFREAWHLLLDRECAETIPSLHGCSRASTLSKPTSCKNHQKLFQCTPVQRTPPFDKLRAGCCVGHRPAVVVQ